MGGQIIKEIHDCRIDAPNVNNYGIGTEWRCDCGKEWQIMYFEGFRMWMQINVPPMIFETTPTNYQKLMNWIKGN